MLGFLTYILEVKKELLVGLSLSLIYITYYLVEAVKKPILICQKGEFREFLEESVPLLGERYWPTPWCVESRLQTVVGSLLRTRLLPPATFRRQVLTLSDGGQVALDWALAAEAGAGAGAGGLAAAGVLLVLPGITGDARADYARCLVAAAVHLRLRCVVVNYRGGGGLPLTTPRLYSAVSHADLAEAVRAVRAVAAGPLVAAGVSLGGLVLAQYLAHAPRAALLAALVVSSPLDVEQASLTIGRIGVHGAVGAERAAVVPHVPQPGACDGRAAGGGGGGVGGGGGRGVGGGVRGGGLARAGERAVGACVRRGVHGPALRVRVGGRVLPRGVAARQAGAHPRAAALPLRRRRPLPAAPRDPGGGGGGVGVRGAGGDGARRPHRVPGGVVAGRGAARPLRGAPRGAVLRGRAAPPRAAAGRVTA